MDESLVFNAEAPDVKHVQKKRMNAEASKFFFTIFTEGLVQQLQKYHMELCDCRMKDSKQMKNLRLLSTMQVGKPTLCHTLGD